MNRTVPILAAIVIVTLSSAAGAADNQPFSVGDVFAGTGYGTIQHWNNDGTVFYGTLTSGLSGENTGMAFDSSGNLYATNFSQNRISVFTGPGTPHNLQPFITTGPSDSESIVFDASGSFYVGHADGNGDIWKYNSAGVFQQSYDVEREDRGSDWIDLAADQRTMYYTSEGRRVLRYDVSTSTQLPDFATGLPGTAYALRILADDSVLVADWGTIVHLDSSGSLLPLQYDAPGVNDWFALNLDPDGTSFWSASYGLHDVFKFDIGTGNILAQFDADTVGSVWTLAGLAVYGEITQGNPDNTIPAPGALLLAGIGTGMVSWIRRKRALV